MPMTRSGRWSADTHWPSAATASRWVPRRPFGKRLGSTSAWPMDRCARSSATRSRRRASIGGALLIRRRPSRPSCQTRTSMSTDERTYESAIERLEAIIRRLDSNEAGLRETLDLVKEGRELIEYAAGELDAGGKGLEELKLDDLIARLEAAQPESSPRN